MKLTCKCGADSYEKHCEKVENGYPAHTYKENVR